MGDEHQTRTPDAVAERSPVEAPQPSAAGPTGPGHQASGHGASETLIRRAQSSRGPMPVSSGRVQPGRPPPRPPPAVARRIQRRSGLPDVQARFALEPANGDTPAQSLVAALRARGALLTEQEPGAGQLIASLRFEQKVEEMLASSIDYGTIDLHDDQQLVQFYYRVKHELADAPAVGEERQLVEESSGAWAAYESSVRRTIGPDAKLYRTALLGRGASAAYAIESGSVPVDDTTVLIGEEQPWRKERGETGVVNHPHNMIDPVHGGGSIGDGGLAPRQDFSDRIDQTIEKIPEVNRINARIDTVVKEGDGAASVYKITTAAGVLYAQRVVAALGIGKHKEPGGLPEDKGTVTDEVPRIMNMDQFQAAVAEGTLLPTHAPNGIVVVGPNAAIDVMTTSFREGFYPISWITGTRRPAFLKGTDNEYVEQRYEEALEERDDNGISKLGVLRIIQHDFLGADADARSITAKYGQRGDKRTKPHKPEVEKGTQGGSILVYGTGPDVSGLLEIFPQVQSGADVEPVYDVGMHFNDDGAGEGGDALTQAIVAAAPKRPDALAEVTRILGNLAPVQRTDKQGAVPNRLPSVVGLTAKKSGADDPTALEFVSGSAARISGALKDPPRYGFASKGFGEVLAELAVLRGHVGQQAKHDLIDKAGEILDGLETLTKKALDLATHVEKHGATTDEGEEILRHERTMEILALARGVGELVGKFTTAVFEHVGRQTGNDETLLEIERRITGLDERNWRHITHLTEFQRQLESTRNGHLAATHMGADPGVGGLPNTLPANVVLADQLTGSRAMVEAAESSMPRSVGAKVDFITHDRTVIATHIAIRYPAIPPALLGYVTSRIIFERRHSKLEDAPLPRPDLERNRYTDFNLSQQQAFQEGWSKKLDALQRTFS